MAKLNAALFLLLKMYPCIVFDNLRPLTQKSLKSETNNWKCAVNLQTIKSPFKQKSNQSKSVQPFRSYDPTDNLTDTYIHELKITYYFVSQKLKLLCTLRNV